MLIHLAECARLELGRRKRTCKGASEVRGNTDLESEVMSLLQHLDRKAQVKPAPLQVISLWMIGFDLQVEPCRKNVLNRRS